MGHARYVTHIMMRGSGVRYFHCKPHANHSVCSGKNQVKYRVRRKGGGTALSNSQQAADDRLQQSGEKGRGGRETGDYLVEVYREILTSLCTECLSCLSSSIWGDGYG